MADKEEYLKECSEGWTKGLKDNGMSMNEKKQGKGSSEEQYKRKIN